MGSKHLPDGTVLTLFGSLEGHQEYREYFDQKPMTLASQNITPTG